MTQKCSICEVRPARTDKGYCANCEAQMGKERKKNGQKVVKYLVYRGNVAGLVPDSNGTYKPIAVSINPERLPKDRTINLDYYCPGFDRSQIKKFKAAIALVYAV